MTTDFTEFVSTFQDETLKAVKQAQDANVAAFTKAGELFAEVATLDKLPAFDANVNPSTFVELSFAYAGKMLELRKEYALALTQICGDATKAFAKAASKN